MGAEPFAANVMADRVCIVTGGGTGIGLATARLLLATGGSVALFGRRDEVLQQAAHQLDPSGSRVVYHACDIREPEQVERAVGFVHERLGRIDVLVNNAGGQFPSPAEAISPNGFQAVVRNNLLGTFNITREVATRAMIPQESGVIINVIANVERGFPGMVHTGAARAGVENMTRTLAVEWVRHNIRVNAVAPGYIATEAMKNYPDWLVVRAKKAVPMKRLGTADEVARPIVFLCSEAAAYISGETLYIDGGARLWGETWPIEDPEET